MGYFAHLSIYTCVTYDLSGKAIPMEGKLGVVSLRSKVWSNFKFCRFAPKFEICEASLHISELKLENMLSLVYACGDKSLNDIKI